MNQHLASSSRVIIVTAIALFFSLSPKRAYAEGLEWNKVETRFTAIHYQAPEDLETFYSRIDYGPNHWGIKRLFSSSAPGNLQDVVARKVDLLFERVQSILGMRKKMDRVHVRLHQDKDQLHQVFLEIYRQECRLRAWYRYKNNTVYLNLQDLNEGMLAHELAHAVIDHYLLVRPPRATAEILARYVDSHLKDD
jgi:hypothetical protein